MMKRKFVIYSISFFCTIVVLFLLIHHRLSKRQETDNMIYQPIKNATKEADLIFVGSIKKNTGDVSKVGDITSLSGVFSISVVLYGTLDEKSVVPLHYNHLKKELHAPYAYNEGCTPPILGEKIIVFAFFNPNKTVTCEKIIAATLRNISRVKDEIAKIKCSGSSIKVTAKSKQLPQLHDADSATQSHTSQPER